MKKNLFMLGFVPLLLCALSCEKGGDYGENYEKGEYVESDEYSFYVTFGTMPTLYAGLYLMENEVPSYVFYERTATFLADRYPAHAEMCPYLGADNDIQAKMADWMKNTIRMIDEKNPDAKFNLYVDDLRAGPISHDWFAALGIDMSRVKVHMLSDGTGTYNQFYGIFNEAGKGEAEWKKLVDEINSLDWNSGEGDYVETKAHPDFETHWHWCYPLSTRDNYSLTMHDGNLLESGDPYVQARMKEMNIVNDNVVAMFNRLSPDNQGKFLEMVPYDRQVFVDLMDESPKPNLIINGTNGQPDNQRNYVGQVYEKYKDDYDVFFEPHPADESYLDYEETFPGLRNVPKMSFEFVMMFISEKIDAIGGFPSTIYLTVPVEKVRFMFAAGPESMPRPLNQVFASAPEGQIDYMLK